MNVNKFKKIVKQKKKKRKRKLDKNGKVILPPLNIIASHCTCIDFIRTTRLKSCVRKLLVNLA